MPRKPKLTDTGKRLAAYFERNGCVRRQHVQRLREEGHSEYKKGDEMRLTAQSLEEFHDIRSLLSEAGFTPGRGYQKGNNWRIPIYGRLVVDRFLELIGADGTR